MANILDKDYETIILKALKEWKEEVKIVKKMICEQN